MLWLPALIGAAVLLPLGLDHDRGRQVARRCGCRRHRSSRQHTAQGEDIVPVARSRCSWSPCSSSAWAVVELRRRGAAAAGRTPRRRRRRLAASGIAVGVVLTARGARVDRRRDVDDRADRRVGQPRGVGGLVQRRAARAAETGAGGARSAAAEGERLAEVRLPRGAFALVDAARALGRGVDEHDGRRPHACTARAARRRPARRPRSRPRGSRRRCARSTARCRAAGAGTGSGARYSISCRAMSVIVLAPGVGVEHRRGRADGVLGRRRRSPRTPGCAPPRAGCSIRALLT